MSSKNLSVSPDVVEGNIEIPKADLILKNALIFLSDNTRPPSTARSDHVQQQSLFSWITVNCFPFDVIVFAMLPAHDVWRSTVSLLNRTVFVLNLFTRTS